MRTVLLAGVRAYAPRLLATAAAVTLSVAFLVGTLLTSATFVRSSEESLTANMVRADVWVGATDEAVAPPGGGDLLLELLPTVRGAPHVAAADAERTAYGRIRVADQRASAQISALLDEQVRWQELAAGQWPAQPTDVVVDTVAAATYGLDVGDTVAFQAYRSDLATFTVVGLSAAVGPGVVLDMPRLLVTGEGLVASGVRTVGSEILVRGDGGPPEQVAAAVTAALAETPGLEVLTRAEATEHRLAQLSGSATTLTAVLLGFCVVAFVVAAIVIGNTFQVLVAQRTRELALLRCIGAGTGQVHRLVLGEAAVLGAVASVVGAAVGVVGAHVLAVTRVSPHGIVLLPWVPVAGVGVGVALTVVAAWPPARRATRVRPVEALRPADVVPAGVRAAGARLVVAVLLLAAGAYGALAATRDGGLALAVPAVVVSFLGVLVAAPLVVPWCVRGAGLLVSWVSAAARLAALNATRNRRRTTATATALLVGVTLVTTMVVATSSVRSSVDAEIDASRPIDLVVVTQDAAGIDAVTRATVEDLPEVVASAAVTGRVPVGLVGVDGGTVRLVARGVDPAAAQRVARAPLRQPTPGTVLVHPDDAQGWSSGETVDLVGDDATVTVVAEIAPDVSPGTVRVHAGDLADVVTAAPVMELELRLTSDLTGTQVQQVMSTVLSTDHRVDVAGGAPERAMYGHLLDTMLLAVLGLLSMALVIAVVGVGNTMALSVVERRHESAVLRAVGLSVGQLRGMLAVEAALIACVAAAIGIALGLAYAWTGVMALGVEATRVPMRITVPAGSLGVILGAAVLAGAVASLLPGRRAGKVSPAEALAVD